MYSIGIEKEKGETLKRDVTERKGTLQVLEFRTLMGGHFRT